MGWNFKGKTTQNSKNALAKFPLTVIAFFLITKQSFLPLITCALSAWGKQHRILVWQPRFKIKSWNSGWALLEKSHSQEYPLSPWDGYHSVIMERRAEGRRHLSSWTPFLGHKPNPQGRGGSHFLPDSLGKWLFIPLQNGMPRTLSGFQESWTEVTLQQMSQHSCFSVHLSYRYFQLAKHWRWERWQAGGNQGWFLLWSSGCCGGRCQLRRDPCAHLSSLCHLQLGQLGTLKSAMAGVYTTENGKSYKWVVSLVCFFLRVSY